MYLEVSQGRDGQWYIEMKSHNHQTLNVSEGYSRLWNAKRAVRKIVGVFDIPVKWPDSYRRFP